MDTYAILKENVRSSSVEINDNIHRIIVGLKEKLKDNDMVARRANKRQTFVLLPR